MRPFLLSLMLLLSGCASIASLTVGTNDEPECRPGARGLIKCSFNGAPVLWGDEITVPNPDNRRYFLTRTQLNFIDASGKRWTAPAGTATDGASIPSLFEALIGGADSPEFREASAIHDAYCGRGNEALPVYQSRGWRAVHRSFYDALIVNGVGEFRAKVMFVAVYLGGPRWNDPEGERAALNRSQLGEAQVYRDWIAQDSPSVASVQYVMDERDDAIAAVPEDVPAGIQAAAIRRAVAVPSVDELRAIAATRP